MSLEMPRESKIEDQDMEKNHHRHVSSLHNKQLMVDRTADRQSGTLSEKNDGNAGNKKLMT